MTTLKMFPPSVVAMQKELAANHPELLAQVQNASTLNEQLAIVATYCDVIMDGMYDVGPACDYLLQKLKNKSSIIITVGEPQLILPQ